MRILGEDAVSDFEWIRGNQNKREETVLIRPVLFSTVHRRVDEAHLCEISFQIILTEIRQPCQFRRNCYTIIHQVPL